MTENKIEFKFEPSKLTLRDIEIIYISKICLLVLNLIFISTFFMLYISNITIGVFTGIYIGLGLIALSVYFIYKMRFGLAFKLGIIGLL